MIPNNQLTADGWAWTPEGKELLRIIQQRIDVYGGRNSLALKIVNESRVKITPNYTNPISKNSIIFNSWDKIPTHDIAIKLGVSAATVLRKAAFLGLGINKATKNSQSTKRGGDLILNLETGIYYNSTLEAAETVGFRQSTLNKKLNGNRPNNTKFIRIN